MGEDEFWHATPRYFDARQKAYSAQVRAGWEQARYTAFYSMSPHVKKGSLRRFTDLGLFPWESEEVIKWAPIDPEELAAFEALADSVFEFHKTHPVA